jgi:hypothetical protein
MTSDMYDRHDGAPEPIESPMPLDVQAQKPSRRTHAVEDERDDPHESISSRHCRCKDIHSTNDLIRQVKAERDLESKVSLLEGMTAKDWSEMCHQHVRTIAGDFKLLNSRKNIELIQRIAAVQETSLQELWGTAESRDWFRKDGKPSEEGDELGPFKFAEVEETEFEFDRERVWRRYAGEGVMESFLRDGNVVVKGLFNWIVRDKDLMAMVEAEFDMYCHHLQEQNGRSKLGWCRNMWHSLVQ